jgi:post-segregation antitoxin (ccd killing protein)
LGKKQNTTISVDRDLPEKLRAKGINISELCQTAMLNALSEQGTYSKQIYEFIAELQRYKAFLETKNLTEEYEVFKANNKSVA